MTTTSVSLTGIQAAIFDMDGTMVANMGHHKLAWIEFFRRHGIELSDEQFRKDVSGKKNNAILSGVFGRELSTDEIDAYADEKEAVYREMYAPDIREIEGLSQCINALAERGIRLAIATTAILKNREFALEALGLQGKFEVILGDEHVSNGKPHPEIYLKTAQQLGIDPSACIAFEDSPPGVASAKAAGMQVVGILSSHDALDLEAADYTVDHYLQIQFA